MSNEQARLEDLRRTLINLAQRRGDTVPEAVEAVKAGILQDGADPEIVAGFFADLDTVASWHIN